MKATADSLSRPVESTMFGKRWSRYDCIFKRSVHAIAGDINILKRLFRSVESKLWIYAHGNKLN
jgi:hypothetical protein